MFGQNFLELASSTDLLHCHILILQTVAVSTGLCRWDIPISTISLKMPMSVRYCYYKKKRKEDTQTVRLQLVSSCTVKICSTSLYKYWGEAQRFYTMDPLMTLTQNVLHTVIVFQALLTLHVSDLVHGFRAVISTTPQWISGLNSRSKATERTEEDSRLHPLRQFTFSGTIHQTIFC